MGYQALLFCPDEKTARSVSQVLSELDFSVEPCTEPFAAVKRLMAQRFDAVVVDCDNEQNATLLFKSARNSSSNQSSLAVAVVEGQAGVAKAFRIGANLVLTKPINIEQAKGTLRVARGLLRKGSEASKPTSAPNPSAAITPSTPTTPRSIPPRVTSGGQAARPAVPPTKLPKAPAPPPVASPSLQAETVDVEPILELEQPGNTRTPATGVRPTPPATPRGGVKPNFPWQPVVKTTAEPMASAMRKAAESAKVEAQPTAKAKPVTTPAAPNRRSAVSVSSGMAAAAPAPAKEFVTPSEVKAPAVKAPTPSPKTVIEVDAGVETKTAAVEVPAPKSVVTPDLEPPSFSMGSQDWDEEERSSGKKALAIVAAVVILAASAGYLSWRNTNKHTPQPTAAPAATPTVENSTSNATGTKPEDSARSPQAEPIQPPSTAAKPSPIASSPRTSPATKPSVKESSTPAPAAAAPEAEPAPQPLVVKRDASRQAAPTTTGQSSEPAPPPTLGVTSDSDTKELANLSSAPVGVPKPSPQVLKISQGVSEGLVLKKVAPKYPAQAIQMRIQGAVQMQATISKDGHIANLKVLTGDSLLARAAQDAVKQWKYKPYYLNGEPVEIQTLITVNFKLPN